MKVILDIIIICKDDQALLRTEVETTLQPVPGVLIEHAPWSAEPRQPTSVSYNLVDGSCHLHFAHLKAKSKQEYEALCQMYEQHGWTDVGKSAHHRTLAAQQAVTEATAAQPRRRNPPASRPARSYNELPPSERRASNLNRKRS